MRQDLACVGCGLGVRLLSSSKISRSKSLLGHLLRGKGCSPSSSLSRRGAPPKEGDPHLFSAHSSDSIPHILYDFNGGSEGDHVGQRMTHLDRTFGCLLTCAHIHSVLHILGFLPAKMDFMLWRSDCSHRRSGYPSELSVVLLSRHRLLGVLCFVSLSEELVGAGPREWSMALTEVFRFAFFLSFLRGGCRTSGTPVMVLSCPLLAIKM